MQQDTFSCFSARGKADHIYVCVYFYMFCAPACGPIESHQPVYSQSQLLIGRQHVVQLDTFDPHSLKPA